MQFNNFNKVMDAMYKDSKKEINDKIIEECKPLSPGNLSKLIQQLEAMKQESIQKKDPIIKVGEKYYYDFPGCDRIIIECVDLIYDWRISTDTLVKFKYNGSNYGCVPLSVYSKYLTLYQEPKTSISLEDIKLGNLYFYQYKDTCRLILECTEIKTYTDKQIDIICRDIYNRDEFKLNISIHGQYLKPYTNEGLGKSWEEIKY